MRTSLQIDEVTSLRLSVIAKCNKRGKKDQIELWVDSELKSLDLTEEKIRELGLTKEEIKAIAPILEVKN